MTDNTFKHLPNEKKFILEQDGKRKNVSLKD